MGRSISQSALCGGWALASPYPYNHKVPPPFCDLVRRQIDRTYLGISLTCNCVELLGDLASSTMDKPPNWPLYSSPYPSSDPFPIDVTKKYHLILIWKLVSQLWRFENSYCCLNWEADHQRIINFLDTILFVCLVLKNWHHVCMDAYFCVIQIIRDNDHALIRSLWTSTKKIPIKWQTQSESIMSSGAFN
jgi:hypothetical protein